MDSQPDKSPFLARVRDLVRVQNYAIRTEQTYVDWIRRFILFNDKRHPDEMGEQEVAAFLTHLAVNRNAAPATLGQALNALVYLYAKVLNRPMGEITGIVRPKKKQKIPVVLSQLEVRNLLSELEGLHWLVACLLYGSGLRLMEGIRLRVKDIDFDRLSITVKNGKGGKDRVVTLARELVVPLKRHLESVKMTHERDLDAGFGRVYLLYALERKYPAATTNWGWQYVFPATRRSVDPRSGITRRIIWMRRPSRKRLKLPCEALAGFCSCKTRIHYIHVDNIRTVQEQLGHSDVKTTEIYTHILGRGGNTVISPLETLLNTSGKTGSTR
jgi:integron integrase